MTLHDALSRYLTHAPDLSPSTAKRMRYDVNRWLRLGGPPEVERIDKSAVVAFRLEASPSLSPWSVEGTIDAILLLLKFLHRDGAIMRVPFAGRRLRKRRQVRYVPPVSDIGAVYAAAVQATFPKPDYCWTTDWWRAFLVVGYTTGLRLSDMLRTLAWDHVQPDRIVIQAAKTQKVQVLPLLPCCKLALNRIRSKRPGVFPVRNVPALRAELVRLCHLSGVPPFSPQSLRRAAANEYESARPGAGAVLLGHALHGATAHYVSVPRILQEAAEKLALPSQFSVGESLDAIA